MKQGRAWFPLDADFTREPAILRAGERSGWLFIASLGKIRLTGSRGFITRQEIESLGLSRPEPRLAGLIRVGLIEQTEADSDVLWVPSWESWHLDSSRARYMREWRARTKDARRLRSVDDDDHDDPWSNGTQEGEQDDNRTR